MSHQVDHHEHHVQLEQWCNEASRVLGVIVERLDYLEHRTADLAARISEWEAGPR